MKNLEKGYKLLLCVVRAIESNAFLERKVIGLVHHVRCYLVYLMRNIATDIRRWDHLKQEDTLS